MRLPAAPAAAARCACRRSTRPLRRSAAPAACCKPPAACACRAAGSGRRCSPVAEESKEPAGPLSPLVRKMARENNIDLAKVTGTGAGGRITKEDVEGLSESTAAAPAAPAPRRAGSCRLRSARSGARSGCRVRARIGQAQPTAKTRVEPMSNMRHEDRRAHGDEQAHFGACHHRASRRHDARGEDAREAQGRFRGALRHVADVPAVRGARGCGSSARRSRSLNASIDGTNIIYHNEINLGIAVALENGLIVPVIRNADEKNVLGLQRSIVDLASRARAKQLKPDEIQGGTFSITNFGSFGSVFATPVINQPQVAILGVGTVEKVPVVVDDAIAIRSQCYLALTFDHRLIDGALGDQFTAKVKSVLENWSEDVL